MAVQMSSGIPAYLRERHEFSMERGRLIVYICSKCGERTCTRMKHAGEADLPCEGAMPRRAAARR